MGSIDSTVSSHVHARAFNYTEVVRHRAPMTGSELQAAAVLLWIKCCQNCSGVLPDPSCSAAALSYWYKFTFLLRAA